MPNYRDPVVFLAFGAIGVSFCWAYSTDRERLWWAIIPGLGALSLLVAVLADYAFGRDPQNRWISALVLGVGSTIIAAVLKRMSGARVLIIVATFSFLVFPRGIAPSLRACRRMGTKAYRRFAPSRLLVAPSNCRLARMIGWTCWMNSFKGTAGSCRLHCTAAP